MNKRVFAAALMSAAVLAFGSAAAPAKDPRQPEFNTMWVFGDSLSDSGNLFFLSGDTFPPSPPYFDGRFSDGPVWVEGLAPRLGLAIDFDTPVFVDVFARNRAIAGAFTDEDGESGPGTGVLSQVNLFLSTVGAVHPDDLVVVWAGANDYFSTDTLPSEAVGHLADAVATLAQVGARRFLVPNLPNLGDTPLARLVLTPAQAEGLNLLTAAHNAALAQTMGEIESDLGVDVLLLDANAAFAELAARQRVFGYDNVSVPCLIQQPDGSRPPSGACGIEVIDATGTLFFDLIHPAGRAHELLAAFAHAALVASEGLPDTVFDPERITTQIAIGKLRAAGAHTAPRP